MCEMCGQKRLVHVRSKEARTSQSCVKCHVWDVRSIEAVKSRWYMCGHSWPKILGQEWPHISHMSHVWKVMCEKSCVKCAVNRGGQKPLVLRLSLALPCHCGGGQKLYVPLLTAHFTQFTHDLRSRSIEARTWHTYVSVIYEICMKYVPWHIGLAVCCSVLQCVAVCCSVLQCVAFRMYQSCMKYVPLLATRMNESCLWMSLGHTYEWVMSMNESSHIWALIHRIWRIQESRKVKSGTNIWGGYD